MVLGKSARRSFILPLIVALALNLCGVLFTFVLISYQTTFTAPGQNRTPQSASAQTAGKRETTGDEDEDVIRISTNEVLVPVSVRDRQGRLVTGLTRKDFRVFEDGREQPLNDLALRSVPVDVVLMIDASSSAASNLENFRHAAEEFAARLSPEDRICLIKFDDRVELLQDWTRSRVQLHRALRRIAPGIFTRFNDALLLAAREQLKSSPNRRAVIVLTDGIDSGRGAATMGEAVRALLESQASVYVVGNTEIERARKEREVENLTIAQASARRFNELRIEDLREGLRALTASEQTLAQLSAATGGKLYRPHSFDALDDVYAEVANELRNQYALYYTPLNKAHDGSFRRVRVETINPMLQPSTRVGYYAPRR
ncbi:MAG: VWA domain-containing protein [Pyrinomonadaceae bacterium]